MQSFELGAEAALHKLGLSQDFLKLAVRIKAMHGTNGTWKTMVSGHGKPILASDPNPRGLYTATARRAAEKPISGFAHSAVKARGGTPTIASGKIDTAKGWAPHTLTAWGKQNIGELDDAKDLLATLETAPAANRGALWEKIQRGIGAWHNYVPGAVWTPSKFRPTKF